MTVIPLPTPAYQYGKVVGRVVHAIADTPDDVDAYPEGRPAQGTVTFKPRETLRVVTSPDAVRAFVTHEPVVATLGTNGRLVDAEGNDGIWLVTGTYDVSFQVTRVGAPKLQPLVIAVTTYHSDDSPYDLTEGISYVPPSSSVTVQTLQVPTGGTSGDMLVKSGEASMAWIPAPDVTAADIAALESSVAGKVDTVNLDAAVAEGVEKGGGFLVPSGLAANGTTSDRTAINNAISAASAASAFGAVGVLLPWTPNGYAIDNNLTMRTGVRLRAVRPVTIKATASMAKMVTSAASASDMTIEGITFDAAGNVTSYMVEAVANSANLKVVDCTFTNSTGTAPQGFETRDNARRVHLLRCKFDGLKLGVRVNRNPDDVRIEKCEFTNWIDRGIQVLGVTGFAAKNLWITGNLFRPHAASAGSGAVRQPIQFSGVDSDKFKNVHVTGNTVIGIGTSHDDPTTPGSADLISLHRCDGFEVSGNIVLDSGDVGITVSQQCARGVIANNTVVGSDSAGICVGSATSASTRDITVTGNTCVNNGLNRNGNVPTWARNGINVNHAQEIVIAGNRCGDDQGTKTQQYGITIQHASGVTVGKNNLRGNAVGEVDVSQGNNTALSFDDVRRSETTADQTVNNSTTLVNSALTVPVDAGGVYRVEGFLRYNSSTGADLALKWSVPSGTMNWTSNGPSSTTTSPNTTVQRTGHTVGTTATIGGSGGNVDALPLGVLAVGTTGGSVTLQFAQGTAEVSDTILRAGSWIQLTRIA